MGEYVDRKALGNAMTIAAVNGKNKDRRTWAKAICLLHDMQTADVAPVRHGQWEEYLIPNILCCSNCDWGIDPLCKSPYCPNCGAKMDERVDDNA